MDYIKKLEKLRPLLKTKTVELEPELVALIGSECFSGSLKGTSAYGCLARLLHENGERAFSGKILLDASSGNFARALALLGEYLDLGVEVVVSTKATQSTLDLITAHGAKLVRSGDTTLECYEEAKKMYYASPDKYTLVSQLENWGNPQGHYDFTGPLIQERAPKIDEIYMPMGSGGGMYGICKYIKEHMPYVSIYTSVAAPGNKIVGTYSDGVDYETPFIKEGRREGWISDEIEVTESEARENMIKLRNNYAILPGFSAGGVYAAYRKRKKAGLTKGQALLLFWDNHDRWLEKLNK